MKNLKLLLIAFFLIQGLSTQAAKVDTLAIPSIAMNKTYNAAVVLPNSYSKSKAKYPVMYLLHGAYGHFRDWLKATPNKMTVKDLADRYDIIIVMPEGETFSFYLDSPVNKGSQFETYITKEVVQKIDQTYRTINEKKGRAITGLSMGGHGALYLATKHPDIYAAAGSMSGAVDMGTMKDMGIDSPERIDQLMEPVFGPQGAPREVYATHAVLNMIDKMKANGLPLIIDCGVDDFLIGPNRELHRRLVYNKVPHDYTERPGTHNWEYWENSVPYHVLFFSKIFKTNNATVQ